MRPCVKGAFQLPATMNFPVLRIQGSSPYPDFTRTHFEEPRERTGKQREWLITVHPPAQGLEVSWRLSGHTTITTWWCSAEVTSGTPPSPRTSPASSLLSRGTRGKSHLPKHSRTIYFIRLLVKFSTNTKGWVARTTGNAPLVFTSFPRSDL